MKARHLGFRVLGTYSTKA